MSTLRLEIGDNKIASSCDECNLHSFTGHGFIYKNDDAYSVYYAAWSEKDSDLGVSLAIAVGEWDDDSTNECRTCFGVEAFENEDQVSFRIIEPNDSPWPSTDLLGSMISRERALNHELLQDIFKISEEVVRNHPTIRDYLGL